MRDFDKQVLTSEGKEIPDNMRDEKPPLTVGQAVVHALFMQFPDEDKMSGEEKFKRAKLAMDLLDDNDMELTAEQISLCKKLVAKLYTPLIVYRVWGVLDEAEVKKKPKLVEKDSA